MRRRYELVVAQGPPKLPGLVGVKPTSKPGGGGGQRFVARVSLTQVCIHLGSFGTSLEGAWGQGGAGPTKLK